MFFPLILTPAYKIGMVSFHFCRWENGGSERLSNLLRFPQLVSAVTEFTPGSFHCTGGSSPVTRRKELNSCQNKIAVEKTYRVFCHPFMHGESRNTGT